MAVAAGLLKPCAGAVTLDGRPLAQIGRRDLAQRRAYLPQSPRADWPISVERVVALGLTPSLPAFGALPAALAAKVEAALLDYELLVLRHRPATELFPAASCRAPCWRARWWATLICCSWTSRRPGSTPATPSTPRAACASGRGPAARWSWPSTTWTSRSGSPTTSWR